MEKLGEGASPANGIAALSFSRKSGEESLVGKKNRFGAVVCRLYCLFDSQKFHVEGSSKQVGRGLALA